MPTPLTGIIYIPLDIRFGRDPKIRALTAQRGMEGLAAACLYLLMALHCREHQTDGIVAEDEIGALAYPLPPEQWRLLLKHLAEHRLIEDVSDSYSSRQADPSSGRLTDPLSDRLDDRQADPSRPAWEVRAYLKRNGSREDNEKRYAQQVEAGRRGGSAPRASSQVRPRAKRPLSDPSSGPLKQPLSQKEKEKETKKRAGQSQQPRRGSQRSGESNQSSHVTTATRARDDADDDLSDLDDDTAEPPF